MPLSLPTGRKLIKDVRMILMEKIPRKSMLELDQNTLPESERLEHICFNIMVPTSYQQNSVRSAE